MFLNTTRAADRRPQELVQAFSYVSINYSMVSYSLMWSLLEYPWNECWVLVSF